MVYNDRPENSVLVQSQPELGNNCHVGRTDINKLNRAKFILKYQKVFVHSTPLAVLRTCERPVVTTMLLHEAPVGEQDQRTSVRIAMIITILAKSKTLVAFVTSKSGLMTIERIKRAKPTQQTLRARGLV